MLSRIGSGPNYLFWLLVVILGAVPFALVAYPWAWGYWAVLVFFGTAAWAGVLGYRMAPIPPAMAEFQVLLLLALALLAYSLLVIMPLPAEVIGWVNPMAMEVREHTTEGAISEWSTLSLNPNLGLRAFLRLSAYVALFLLVLVAVTSRARARLLAYVLVATIVLHALWGLFDWGVLHNARGRASGMFGTANLFAGFIELGLGLIAGLPFTQQGSGRNRHWKGSVVGLIDWMMSIRAGLVIGLVAMLAALLATASRGAALSTLLAFLIGTSLLVVGRKPGAQVKRFVIFLMLICITSVVWLGADTLRERFTDIEFGENSRLSFWRPGLEMVTDYPIVGMGAGAWFTAYPMYREPQSSTSGLPSNAHNDHLQFLIEYGVVGYLLFGCFLVVCLFRLIATLRRRRNRFVRGIVFGVLVSLLSLLFHAFFDYNFQVTATTAYFFTILALGLAVGRLEVRKTNT